MDEEAFYKLDMTTEMSLIIAMHIRTEMENFHVKYLSDQQMEELNRSFVKPLTALCHITLFSSKNSIENSQGQDMINFLI